MGDLDFLLPDPFELHNAHDFVAGEAFDYRGFCITGQVESETVTVEAVPPAFVHTWKTKKAVNSQARTMRDEPEDQALCDHGDLTYLVSCVCDSIDKFWLHYGVGGKRAVVALACDKMDYANHGLTIYAQQDMPDEVFPKHPKQLAVRRHTAAFVDFMERSEKERLHEEAKVRYLSDYRKDSDED